MCACMCGFDVCSSFDDLWRILGQARGVWLACGHGKYALSRIDAGVVKGEFGWVRRLVE